MIKIIIFISIVFLSGCSVKPIHYQKNHNNANVPMKIEQNIPKISVKNFRYIPHKNISQYATSSYGCLICDNEGGTQAFVYEQPIQEIVQAEVENALEEISIDSSKNNCSLEGQIHAIGWNGVNGTSLVDITYTLKVNNSTKYIKRLKSKYWSISSMFKIDLKQWMAKPVRKSIEELVSDKNFVKTITKNCQ